MKKHPSSALVVRGTYDGEAGSYSETRGVFCIPCADDGFGNLIPARHT